MTIQGLATLTVAAAVALAPPAATASQASPMGSERPVIMVVVAHPDDEIVIAPAIANAARRGARVRIVFATAGDAAAPETELAPGPAVAALRTDEARCAARALGAEEPVMLGFGDGKLGEIVRPPAATLENLRNRIDTLIAQERPSVVITWGPDGGYGHPDHRLVSAVVTDLLSRRSDGPHLLYAALPAIPEVAAMGWAGIVDTQLTVRASYDEQDLAAAKRALACHASQFDDKMRGELIPMLDGLAWKGAVPFRSPLAALRGEDLLALGR